MWKSVKRFTRKITKGHGIRNINLPKEIYEILFKASGENTIQYVLMENNGKKLIAICDLDGYNNIQKLLNGE